MLLLLLTAAAFRAQAQVAVVTHPAFPVDSMTVREVSDLYMGRTRVVKTTTSVAYPVKIYDQTDDSVARAYFFKVLNGMDLAQVNAYWARLRFSGQVLPHTVLADDNAVIDAVSRNKSAIGYVGATAVTGRVRVLLLL